MPDNQGNTKGEAPISMDVPETSAAPIPLIEPMITIEVPTSMGQDQKMGTVCVLTMTASMEIMNVEAPSMTVGH